MTSGYYKRSKPELSILKGNAQVDTSSVIGDNVPVEPGVVIKSGQVCYKNWGGTLNTNPIDKYVMSLGCVAGAVPYFAVNDSDQGDVVGSGLLRVISAQEVRVIQTAFFAAAASTYSVGAALTYDGTSGNVKVAGTGDVIIGYVEREQRASDVDAAAAQRYANRDIQADGDYDGFTTGTVLTMSTGWTGFKKLA